MFFMKIYARNKRAGWEAGLSWFRDIILFLAITFAGYFLIVGISAGNLMASNAARNAGAVISMAALSPYDIEITNECPKGYYFRIVDGNKIRTTAQSFMGTGEAEYWFLVEKNVRASGSATCGIAKTFLKISKTGNILILRGTNVQ